MAKRSIDKQLLANYIRHAGGHNKIQEEQEMWRVRSLEVRNERLFDDWERKRRQPPLVRGHLVSDTLDDQEIGDYRTPPPSSSSSPTPRESSPQCTDSVKLKQLMKREERDPFRWGHAGYKELYPDTFESSDEEGERERKSKKSQSKKRKREHKDKKKTKRRRLKLEEGEASSKTKSVESTKKKKPKRKREREITSSLSETNDRGSDEERDKYSGSEVRGAGKRKRKRKSRHKH